MQRPNATNGCNDGMPQKICQCPQGIAHDGCRRYYLRSEETHKKFRLDLPIWTDASNGCYKLGKCLAGSGHHRATGFMRAASGWVNRTNTQSVNIIKECCCATLSKHLWNETSHLLILIYWAWILAIRRDAQDIQWNLTIWVEPQTPKNYYKIGS